MASKYLNRAGFTPTARVWRWINDLIALREIKARAEARIKQRAVQELEEKVNALEVCTPFCQFAAFPNPEELCQYNGVLKCSKYNALVPKYSACLKGKEAAIEEQSAH